MIGNRMARQINKLSARTVDTLTEPGGTATGAASTFR